MPPSSESTAWVKLLPVEDLPPQLSTTANPYYFGFVAGMTRLIRTHPRIGNLFGNLSREIMFGEGRLSRRERELIAAVASGAQDCFY